MKTATFDNSVKVLLKAYLNDTLVHGNCFACAVGNLVACGIGTSVVNTGSINSRKGLGWANDEIYPGEYDTVDSSGWGALFSTSNNKYTGRKKQEINHEYLESVRAMNHIESTGYSWKQLAAIEKAFEFVDKRCKDKMFLGLMAVIDVLAEIHNIDLVTVKETKELFA